MNTTLLLVDDEAMNRDALSRRLIRHGYDVVTADRGQAALDLLDRGRVDAVLLDIMMPGMSGIETLRRIRLTRSVADLPVIMVTANDRSDDVVQALDLGANDYITKPVDFAVALARIRAQVSARRADPLTGLPNRLQFMDRLERRLAKPHDAERVFAVFFVDVDRFKLINDTFGHLAGDELLVALARRLESTLRATDTVARHGAEHAIARLGGDEFTILLDGLRDVMDARAVAERLIAAMVPPFSLQGREVFTSLSIGVVLSDARYQAAADMIRDADAAMYRAKTRGKARYEVFDTSMLEAVTHRLELEADLRHAVARNELRVHYQPIVSLGDRQLTGFEALARWQHPERGLIGPADFIPIAEDTGLIVQIGAWVLEAACRQMRSWLDAFPGHGDMVVNVNLSSKQVLQPDIEEQVAQTLDRTGLPARHLKLEITETVVLVNSDAVVGVLTDLRALGVQLGLDDFGMGYSALSYLQRFPFQTLKIDRSFVSGLHEGGNAEIVRAIVSLAAGLDMDVTAEGVETADQLQGLRQLACESGQGFYFSRPLEPGDATTLLQFGASEVAAAASATGVK